MKLISIKPDNSLEEGVFKAEFSDSQSLLFSTAYLSESLNIESWEEDREISAVEEDALKFAADCYKAEKVALRLIARAEQSSLGLTAKLEKRGVDSAVVRSVISRLLDRELLDDGRYAELWVRSRLGRKVSSPLELLVSLGKRGIDRGLSQNAVKKILDEETEYSLLLRYLEKTDPSRLEKTGVQKMLKYEGFSREVINRFLDSQ